MRLDSGKRVLVEYRLDLTVRGASELYGEVEGRRGCENAPGGSPKGAGARWRAPRGSQRYH